jgi:hypothetical protein
LGIEDLVLGLWVGIWDSKSRVWGLEFESSYIETELDLEPLDDGFPHHFGH